MRYPEIVTQARETARTTGEPFVVYHNLEHNSYNYTTDEIFKSLCMTVPIVRMLRCLPNGTVVQ